MIIIHAPDARIGRVRQWRLLLRLLLVLWQKPLSVFRGGRSVRMTEGRVDLGGHRGQSVGGRGWLGLQSLLIERTEGKEGGRQRG